MKKVMILSLIFLLVFGVVVDVPREVCADTIEETIEKELQGLDLTILENFYNSIDGGERVEFYTLINGFINGSYSINYDNVLTLVKDSLILNFKNVLISLLSIVIIVIIFSLCEQMRGRIMSEGVKNLIRITCVLSIVLIFSKEIISLFKSVKIVIENISKLNEIMSPIMLGLIVSSGGNVTASIYSPTVVFLSNGFISIVLYLLLPLISIIMVFGVMSSFSEKIKLGKFSDFFTSVFKWVLGISVTISGLFITVHGLNASVIDGVSIKAAKYAISNSVPLIGGFLKDGFDIVTSGTIIIKNVIGVTGIIALFYLLLAPVVHLIAYSLAFKLVSAVTEPFSDGKISSLCTVSAKSITYLIICVLVVALMFFVNLIILMISSSAFI